jgi:hypothetical protein
VVEEGALAPVSKPPQLRQGAGLRVSTGSTTATRSTTETTLHSTGGRCGRAPRI